MSLPVAEGGGEPILQFPSHPNCSTPTFSPGAARRTEETEPTLCGLMLYSLSLLAYKHLATRTVTATLKWLLETQLCNSQECIFPTFTHGYLWNNTADT